jgi:hypothetical protein
LLPRRFLRFAGKRLLAQLKPVRPGAESDSVQRVQNAIIGPDDSVVGGIVAAACCCANGAMGACCTTTRRLEWFVEDARPS